MAPNIAQTALGGYCTNMNPVNNPVSSLKKSIAPSIKLPMFLSAGKLEITFVVITLVTMVLGLVTSYIPALSWLTTASYIIAYVTGGWFGLLASIEALRHAAIEVDMLMILAALGAALVDSPFEGAMLLFLFSLSNVLQDYAIGRSRDAIKSLMKLRPNLALIRRNGRTESIGIDQIEIGDRMIVRPGERLALDGTVIEGESTADESSLTGESMPVNKALGDHVFAGTINQSGGLEVQITKLAQDSTIAKLIKLVENAQSEKAETQRFLDTAERYYAAGVILFTLALIALGLLILREPFNVAFLRAMTAMVVASPCALVISTPASILSAIANGARHGVLFKGGAYLEQAADINVVAFDKTGTLTEGRPTVTDVEVVPLFDVPSRPLVTTPTTYTTPARLVVERVSSNEENTLLMLAASVEAKSEHPLAQAILKTANDRGLKVPEVTGFQSITGRGVRATVQFMGGVEIAIGSPRYYDGVEVMGMPQALAEVQRLQDEGKTSVVVCEVGPRKTGIITAPESETNPELFTVLGVIAIADVLRIGAAQVMAQLKQVGVQRTLMLTGDNHRVASAIAAQAGVDGYYADLLPEDKVSQIKGLQIPNALNRNRPTVVAMVGDGVNDAPALATASLGIAMGAAGTDVALETADIVLMANDLSRIPYAIALSKQARRVVIQNLVFSASVILVLLISALGFHLPLPFGVVGHEGSTVLVCLNGLRLLAFKWKPAAA